MANNSISGTFKNLPNAVKGSKGILLAAGSVIALGFGYSLWPHHDVTPTKSQVGGSPTITQHLGDAITPDYQESLNQEDKQRLAEAKKTGGSYIQSIVPHSDTQTGLTTKIDDNDEEGVDKNNAPPELPEDTPHLEAPPPPPSAVTPVQKVAEVEKPKKPTRYVNPDRIQQLERMLAAHMEVDTFKPGVIYTAVKGAHNPDSVGTNGTTSIAYAPQGQGAPQSTSDMSAGTRQSLENAAASSGSGQEPSVAFKIPDAGTILQGHFISAVDSRITGVVMGVIDSGPYHGARVLGKFGRSSDGNNLMVEFSQLAITFTNDDGEKQSKVLPIKAVAVNPSTLSQGMATYVNQHMIARIGSTLATSFMQGLGQAIQQSGSTATYSASGGTVVSQGEKNLTQQFLQAGGQSAGQIGSMLSQMFGDTQTTVKISQFTPFGLLFLGEQG